MHSRISCSEEALRKTRLWQKWHFHRPLLGGVQMLLDIWQHKRVILTPYVFVC